ncbi:hypothetical protein [Caudoviricetes sp.]|nr:hypothetical protein [Caudoviricetes sp.]UOF79121.1 hypothetical protein [Caudoviricetes sp.]
MKKLDNTETRMENVSTVDMIKLVHEQPHASIRRMDSVGNRYDSLSDGYLRIEFDEDTKWDVVIPAKKIELTQRDLSDAIRSLQDDGIALSFESLANKLGLK